MPALLKGFIDRTFLPDVAYKMGNGKLHQKLFTGKSARIIITSDTPRWYNILFLRNPAINQLKRGTLNFCGINDVKITFLSPIRNSTESFRFKWMERINILGQRGQ